jgi:Zn-dependent membrane protease YugP
MFFDPRAFLFLLPALLVAGLAHWWVRSVFREASRIPTRTRARGSDAAAAVLNGAGVGAVFVEDVAGQHLDHYAPDEQGVLLRTEVHDGANLMAVGIAAHETGHAAQDADKDPRLAARTAIVLAATCGSLIGMILFVGGFLVVESILIYAGVVVFAGTVFAQLFNLPIEFDASRRAAPHLVAAGVITPEEEPMVRRVMQAAALTHVAGTLTCIPTAYRYLVKPRRQARDKKLA